MAQSGQRKCLCCDRYFYPDHRNRERQWFCSAAECRRASKAASQAAWLAQPQNSEYFRDRLHVARVQAWRAANPDYRHPPDRGRRRCAYRAAAPGPWLHLHDHALRASGAQPPDRYHLSSGTARSTQALSLRHAWLCHQGGLGRGAALSRPGLSRGPHPVGRQGEGVARHRVLSYRRPRGPRADLRGLRHDAPRLSLLPQSPLPKVSDPSQGSLARRARARGVAGGVLSPRVHPAP